MVGNETDKRRAIRDFIATHQGRAVLELGDEAGLPAPATRGEAQTFHVRVLRRLLEQAGHQEWLDGERISVKTVRADGAGIPLEKMTFRNLSHEGLPRETWPTSDLKKEISEVLIVVFAAEGRNVPIEENELADAFFWSPTADEERLISGDWERCREAVAYGMEPPKERQSQAVHVGTKGQDSADFEVTASGERHKKQCLCFNKRFVAELIQRHGGR